MDTTTVAAFFDELQSIEKEAGIKDGLLALKNKTQILKKGVTAPLKVGERAYDQAGRKAFEHASKLVGTTTAHKAAIKGTELLHKFYA